MAVMIRAQYRCELCGGALDSVNGMSIHHRKPRRMGGTRDPEINEPFNLLVLCGSGTTGCHGKVESNRLKAVFEGVILRANDDPKTTPVKDANGRWWLLDSYGMKEAVNPPTLSETGW
jgi:hypothetical protein